jgi:hypothetical protein
MKLTRHWPCALSFNFGSAQRWAHRSRHRRAHEDHRVVTAKAHRLIALSVDPRPFAMGMQPDLAAEPIPFLAAPLSAVDANLAASV